MNTKEPIGKALVRKGKPPVKKLTELRIPDSAELWRQMGFTVQTRTSSTTSNPVFPFIALSNMTIFLTGSDGRLGKDVGWSFETYPAHHGDMYFKFDGSIPTCLISERDNERDDLIGLSSLVSASLSHRVTRLVISTHSSKFKRTFGALLAMMEMDLITPKGSKSPVTIRGDLMFAYFKNPETGIIIELVGSTAHDQEKGPTISGVVIEVDQPLSSLELPLTVLDKSKIRPTMQDPARQIVEIGRDLAGLSVKIALVHKKPTASRL